MAFHWPRASPLFAVFAFRAVTAVGLLTGIATVFWQVRICKYAIIALMLTTFLHFL